MAKKMIWRLANRPTSEDVVKLLSSGIINKEEAKEILFNFEEEGERGEKSLESEIKFLRELVEKLSKGSTTQIVEVIREIQVPYIRYPWYQPYVVWCSSSGVGGRYAYTSTGTAGIVGNNVGGLTSTAGSTNISIQPASGGKFSAIKTF